MRSFALYVKLIFSIESSHIDSVPKKRTLDANCFVLSFVCQGKLESVIFKANEATWHDVYVIAAPCSTTAGSDLKEKVTFHKVKGKNSAAQKVLEIRCVA